MPRENDRTFFAPNSSERFGIGWRASGGNKRPCRKVGRTFMVRYGCTKAVGLADLGRLGCGVGQASLDDVCGVVVVRLRLGLQEEIGRWVMNHQTSDVSS